MDQPKFERMLRLMRMLSGNVTYSIDELADRLEMSPRTIYRYLDTFKAAGFSVGKVYGNIYRLTTLNDAHLDLSKLVWFSDEEAAIVNGMIDGLDNTNALKIGLKRKLAAVYDSTSIADYIGPKSNASTIQTLSEAIRQKHRVLLHGYKSSHSGQVRDRLVEPFSFTTNYIDVWCYDVDDGFCKSFKIARIDEAEMLPEPWKEEERHKAQPMDVFRMHGPDAIHIKLRLSQMAGNLLQEEYPLSVKNLRKDGDNWIFEGDIRRLQGAGRFVCGLADEIEILEGEELREYVRNFMLHHSTL
ncbi:MAG: WYL domain-containing protein [Bacteroidales bacterium]|nr:WYL domain-containing protein [Bacteroidales bacterium]